LQPADIQEPATGQAFQPVRPAFTKRVPIHGGYIGGEFYFDEAQLPLSVASFVHVAVSDDELATMAESIAAPALPVAAVDADQPSWAMMTMSPSPELTESRATVV